MPAGNGLVAMESGTRLIPYAPDREGYHWVRRYKRAPAIPLCWHPIWHSNAGNGWGGMSQPDREFEWEYLGLCVSPDEIETQRVKETGR